jgi:hypothetical protein
LQADNHHTNTSLYEANRADQPKQPPNMQNIKLVGTPATLPGQAFEARSPVFLLTHKHSFFFFSIFLFFLSPTPVVGDGAVGKT